MSRNGDKQAYPVLGAAEWISLAAAPTFAIMAVLTGTLGGGPPDTFCSAAHRASPLSGMVLMYLLMSAFHSASWLKLISRRRSGARRSSRADGIFPHLKYSASVSGLCCVTCCRDHPRRMRSWEAFGRHAGLDHENYVVGSSGDTSELATERADLVIAGTKRVTASRLGC
jgi:hypothetical protein